MPTLSPDTWGTEHTSFVKSARSETSRAPSAVFQRDYNNPLFNIVGHEGHCLITDDGKRILDATGGAAVSCLGQGNAEIIKNITRDVGSQRQKASYLNTFVYSTESQDAFAQFLINGTAGKLSRVMFLQSGSEATEAAMKLAWQFHREKANPEHQRVNYISREGSYHGNTLGALSISGHLARRKMYQGTLLPNCHRVSACNSYRQRFPGETDAEFVARKAEELEAKFHELGTDTIVAFFCEPIVGAALGAVPFVPGYLKAMRDICHKYGALFILDEVMCGMGRSGYLHAWQEESVVPDIETVGKGLGGGFTAIAAMLVHDDVVKTIANGSGVFVHGHTYQNHPIACATGLAVQRYIADNNLVANVREVGAYFGQKLRSRLDAHPYVGSIRGKGLLWGVEFVANKSTKETFRRETNVAERLRIEALHQGLSVYPAQGCGDDGFSGDVLILAPAFTITRHEADLIAAKLVDVVNAVFRRS